MPTATEPAGQASQQEVTVMNRFACIAIAIVCTASLAGCVSVGTKVDPAAVQAFQPGVTTLAQVEAKLGAPNETVTNSDGTTSISYVFTHAQASGSSFIPIVGAFVGHTNATSTVATLTFDKSGRFVRYGMGQGQTSAGMLGSH